MSTSAERMRSLRAARIAAGLCPRCPSGRINPMRPGGKACAACCGVVADDVRTHRQIESARELFRRFDAGEVSLPSDLAARREF